PKLIAVTGISVGAGTSTLAGGLAASFSETGDGKVLLVDMNLGNAEVYPFVKGKHVSSLSDVLQGGNTVAFAADNLYLATTAPANGRSQHIGLKKLHEMMPDIKASDFDYIVFDMPPLCQTSPTFAMAGLMDKVLIV